MKKGVWIILGIIVVVIVLGLFFYFKGEKFDEQTTSCINNCVEDACVNNCKDLFYYLTVINNKKSVDQKLSECEKIIEPNLKQNCKRKTIYDLGIEEKNPDLCDRLYDWLECKDIIRINIAYENIDYSICGQIEDIGIKNLCLNNVIIRVVRKEGDNSLCEKIIDQQTKESCILIQKINLPEKKDIDSTISNNLGTKLSIIPISSKNDSPLQYYLNLY